MHFYIVIILVSLLSTTAYAQQSFVRDDWIPVIEAKNFEEWSFGFIIRNSSPVGLLKSDGDSVCSGVLISANKFLTASHCVSSESCLSTQIEFLRQFKNSPSRLSNSRCQEIEFSCGKSDSGFYNCDHAVIVLDSNPGIEHGYAKVSRSIPKNGDSLISFHHPHQISKVASTGKAGKVIGNILNHTIPFEEGSSGAPIYNLDGEVVAVQSKGPVNIFNQSQASLIVNDKKFSNFLEQSSRLSNHYGSLIWDGFSFELKASRYSLNTVVSDVDMMRIEALVRKIESSGVDWVHSYGGGFTSDFSSNDKIRGSGLVFNWGFDKRISPRWWLGLVGSTGFTNYTGEVGETNNTLDPNTFSVNQSEYFFGLGTELCRPGMLDSGWLTMCAHANYIYGMDDLEHPNDDPLGGGVLVNNKGLMIGLSLGIMHFF